MTIPMKAVILCGGMGTRLREETEVKPKPMVEIGGKPIVWHIMNIYASFGIKEFVLALGYKGDYIKQYFINYYHHQTDIEVDLSNGKITAKRKGLKDWKVHLIDTGINSMTGGRVFCLKEFLKDAPFMLTYGDGVADINVSKLWEFHRSHGKLATITAVRPVARFGSIGFNGDLVTEFKEKPQTGEGWINGGFMLFEPDVLNYIENEHTVLEKEPLENLARDKQLMVYKHEGFWQCMDTIRDRDLLESLWKSGAPWKTWQDE